MHGYFGTLLAALQSDNRDLHVETLPDALSDYAVIFKQIETTHRLPLLRVLHSWVDLHLDLADAQPTALVAPDLGSHAGPYRTKLNLCFSCTKQEAGAE